MKTTAMLLMLLLSTTLCQAQIFRLIHSSTHPIGSGNDEATCVISQIQNSYLVAGTASDSGDTDIFLMKYRANKIDSTFGTNGFVRFDLDHRNELPNAIYEEIDGSITIAGLVDKSEFIVVRFKQDGIVDSSFGTNGYLTTKGAGAGPVARQDNGGFIISFSSLAGTNIKRISVDGKIDSSFGINGRTQVKVGAGTDLPRSIRFTQNGDIIVAGSNGSAASRNNGYLFKLKPDGMLDSTFGNSGVVLMKFDSTDFDLNSMDLQDDYIYIAGTSNLIGAPAANSKGFVACYSASTGTPDLNFGGNGTVMMPLSLSCNGSAIVAAQHDLFVAGTTQSLDGNTHIVLSDYSTSGNRLSSQTYPDGIATLDWGNSGGTQKVTGICADIWSGTALMVGSATSSNNDIGLALFSITFAQGVTDHWATITNPSIYPNPTTTTATVEYTLDQPQNVTIRIHDLQGNTLGILLPTSKQSSGSHTQTLKLPDSLPTGSYLISIETPKGSVTTKVIVEHP